MVGSRVAVVLLALAAVLLPASASAAEEPDGWGVAWQEPLPSAAVSPGSTSDGVLAISNGRESAVDVGVGVVDLLDEEQECLRQERDSPLEDCRDDGALDSGELAEQVVISLVSDGNELYRGTLTHLAEGRSDPVVVPPGGTRLVEVGLVLPDSSTNETMTDRVTFGLQISAVDVTDGGEVGSGVLGASLDAGGAVASSTSGDSPGAGPSAFAGLLPATGAAVGIGLVLAALVLIGVGAVLWLLGRRGRHVT